MVKRNVLLLILLALLCSCGGTRTRVILKHPETLDFKECDTGLWSVSSRERDECVKQYEAQGYEVWGER